MISVAEYLSPRKEEWDCLFRKEVLLSYGFKIEVWGEYACFSRPELKVERVSYDFITPSAARGVLEAVFWKPAIQYVIDEIEVCQPIRFENIRRNEVNSKASYNKPSISATDDRAQRATMLLKDVRYVIMAHFEPAMLGEEDRLPNGSFNHGKFAEMLKRRLRKGQNYHTPYLGTREFPAKVRLIEDDNDCPSPIPDSRSYGLMLYDIDFEKDSNGNVTAFTPTYFYAVMNNGTVNLRNVEVLR
jgi:CRISPR-associated protein Cas5d